MHFGFALELSDIDLWNIDLLDTHLDLLDTDIPSKYFACLHNVFKTSSRHVFKTSSRHVFKTSSRYVFKTSSRHVFKTSSRRLQNVFARRLQDVLEDVKLLRWRRVEEVFKTNKCLLGYVMQQSHCSKCSFETCRLSEIEGTALHQMVFLVNIFKEINRRKKASTKTCFYLCSRNFYYLARHHVTPTSLFPK